MTMLTLLLIALAACGGSNEKSGSESNGKGSEGSSELENVKLAIATGNTGSAIYALGSGFQQAIERHIPGSKVSVIGSSGYGENAIMLANKEADIGTTSRSAAEAALKDQLEKQPELLDDLRFISTAHQTVVHAVVPANSEIETIEDLKGKTVSVGEPGSGTEATNRFIFEMYGMSYDDINPQYLAFNETTEQFQDGKIDAFILTTMYPNPNIMSLSTQKDIRLLTFDQKDADKLNELYSGQFITTEIPADTYGNKEPIPTIGVPAGYVVHKDMDEKLAYELARIMNEHSDEIARVHPAGEQWGLENALFGKEFKYHAGAVKYFKDVGVWDDRPNGVEGEE